MWKDNQADIMKLGAFFQLQVDKAPKREESVFSYRLRASVHACRSIMTRNYEKNLLPLKVLRKCTTVRMTCEECVHVPVSDFIQVI
jgi:hypothetical protein